MSWKPIDFQGILTLQYALVQNLEDYLNEKETQLVSRLLSIFQGANYPVLPAAGVGSLKLSDAVEAFCKKARSHETLPTSEEANNSIKAINTAFWEYVEVLEGCVVELFQLIKQSGIDQWHSSVPQTLDAVKELLLHRIEDTKWALHRLKTPMRQYLSSCSSRICMWPWSSPLDSKLLSNLDNTETFLKSRYRTFIKLFNAYIEQNDVVMPSLASLHGYPVLPTLEKEDTSLYEQMVHWLRLLELDAKKGGLLAPILASTLKNLVGVDQALTLFKLYIGRMEKSLFSISKDMKKAPFQTDDDAEIKQSYRHRLNLFIEELNDLMGTIVRYREFLIKSDPNPYVRSRLGFTEWIVGPEPLKARTVMQQVFDCKELIGRFELLLRSLSDGEPAAMSAIYAEIERLLHEMSSPLISQAMMRRKADALLGYLDQCNILGSFQFERVAYVGDVLNKAMRADWKYHVLHEFPLFHEIMNEYQGLADREEDPSHRSRIERLKSLFSQIEEWVAKEDVDTHIHEISTDMNDMKVYLQDFLATVQRLGKDQTLAPAQLEQAVSQFRYQLMEYRYLFGSFFLHLIKSEGKAGVQVRNRFLFVDQYFETVDNQLYERLNTE